MFFFVITPVLLRTETLGHTESCGYKCEINLLLCRQFFSGLRMPVMGHSKEDYARVDGARNTVKVLFTIPSTWKQPPICPLTDD